MKLVQIYTRFSIVHTLYAQLSWSENKIFLTAQTTTSLSN